MTAGETAHDNKPRLQVTAGKTAVITSLPVIRQAIVNPMLSVCCQGVIMTVGGVFTLSDECVPALRLAAPVQLLLIHRSKLPYRVIGKLCVFDLP